MPGVTTEVGTAPRGTGTRPSPRAGLGWREGVRGWLGAHAPALLSLLGFLGPLGARGHPRSQGCHPEGVGTHQDPGLALPTALHPPPTSEPSKAPTMGGLSWMPSRDQPWGQGVAPGQQRHSPEPPPPAGTEQSTGKNTPVSPSSDRTSLSPPSESPREPARVPDSTNVPKARPHRGASRSSHKTQIPGIGSVSPPPPEIPKFPPRAVGTLTRAQFSLPGAPGMPPSPFSPSTPSGASRAAWNWAQSPQRVWGEKGESGATREILGDKRRVRGAPRDFEGLKGEPGAPRGVPREGGVTPSPPSHLQHLDVPLSHDGQRSLEKREGGME